MGKQLGHADLDIELLTQARSDPYRQQRMPAEGEEVVVPTNRLQTQQVTPDRGNGLFDCALRCFIRTHRVGCVIRRGQCLAIQLAVRSQGQRFQLYVGRRHHVVRQHIG